MNTFGPFVHRKNPDKTIDSICTACFQTIASEDHEDKLIAHEKSHSCDPYWQYSRASFSDRESALPRSARLIGSERL
jgi:hypothetical protein